MKNISLLLGVLIASSASAMGPIVTGGAVVTLRESASSTESGTVGFNHLVGPVTRVGFELGDRFNHEISFQFSRATGQGAASGFVVPIEILTFAGRYTFSVDFFTKQGLDALPGFTPSLGVGLGIGAFHLDVGGEQRWGPYLEFHAALGFRYTLKNGLGFKLELVGSTYGGFFAVQPSLGVAYRF